MVSLGDTYGDNITRVSCIDMLVAPFQFEGDALVAYYLLMVGGLQSLKEVTHPIEDFTVGRELSSLLSLLLKSPDG